MSYPKHLFKHPGPYGLGPRSYDVAGADDEEREAELMASGWFASKEEAWGQKPDGDEPAKSNMAELRAEYRKLSGKPGGPRWDEATYADKIAALKESK